MHKIIGGDNESAELPIRVFERQYQKFWIQISRNQVLWKTKDDRDRSILDLASDA